ncbi:MAG TPA: DUF1501 domain-containing protein [Frankiaceae bacterium]|nr:DUF1501 domain-containing protein [Frankiaceae bacterium]
MSRTPSRRDVLKGAGVVAGLQLLSPVIFRAGEAWGATQVDPLAADRYRLIVIDMHGGNDGLNTVVPMSGSIRDVYEKVRVTTELPVSGLNPLGAVNGGTVGLHGALSTVYDLWNQNRVAIVQGADYPSHNYSHFVSDDIWQSGLPGQRPGSGWLGRHLDRTGIDDGELRGIGIGGRLPLALRGEIEMGEQVNALSETQFADGAATTGSAGKRHLAFAGYDADTRAVRDFYGDYCRTALGVATSTTGLTAAQPGGVANAMLTARTLLTANLGCEVVFVLAGGYDTHDNQLSRHNTLLTDLDRGIEAFYYGTKGGVPVTTGNPAVPVGPVDPHLASRTLIMTFSEFGRRIGDNGTGTDHGAAGPMFLIGPPAPAAGSGAPVLNPGLHRDHPDLGTVTLPKDNLAGTTDIRSVYQSVLTRWLADEGEAGFVVSGTGIDGDGTLTGLFGTA